MITANKARDLVKMSTQHLEQILTVVELRIREAAQNGETKVTLRHQKLIWPEAEVPPYLVKKVQRELTASGFVLAVDTIEVRGWQAESTIKKCIRVTW